MLKHIVLFKLKEKAEGAARGDNANKLKRELEALPAKIPQIMRMEVGLNAVPSEAAYDVAIYSEFADKDALAIYQKHPEHMKVVELVKKIVEGRAVTDYIT